MDVPGGPGPARFRNCHAAGPIIAIMGPVKLTQKSQCYTVLFLHFFRRGPNRDENGYAEYFSQKLRFRESPPRDKWSE